MNPDEEAFVDAFVVRAKRDRFKGLLAHPKRRAKFLDALNHSRDFDLAYAELVPSDRRHDRAVVEMLLRRGARDVCHVIADSTELDGQDLPLGDAVETATACSYAAIVLCVPGRLAFYKGEDPGEWYLFERDR